MGVGSVQNEAVTKSLGKIYELLLVLGWVRRDLMVLVEWVTET